MFDLFLFAIERVYLCVVPSHFIPGTLGLKGYTHYQEKRYGGTIHLKKYGQLSHF